MPTFASEAMRKAFLSCRGRFLQGIALLGLLPCAICMIAYAGGAQADKSIASASVVIDAEKVEGKISPMLYGQFDEFMFEGVKRGLTAELIRDRGFEEMPNAIGLPRDWQRDPDDRNDDPGLHFVWDDSVYYPTRNEFLDKHPEHSLRVDLGYDDGQRRGIRQSGIPIRQIPYHGYLWIKTKGFSGRVKVALEADWTGGDAYTEFTAGDVGPLRVAGLTQSFAVSSPGSIAFGIRFQSNIAEVREGGTYRAVYTVRYATAIYVLHVFQKKSKSGIGTPAHEIEKVRRRLREAEKRHAQWLQETKGADRKGS